MGELALPFTEYAVVVPTEWTDYNGHMHDASYLSALSEANERLFVALGLSADYRAETGNSYYTVEYQVRFLAECRVGEKLSASTDIAAANPKRLRLVTELRRGDGTVAAKAESLYLHVGGEPARVCALDDARYASVAVLVSEGSAAAVTAPR